MQLWIIRDNHGKAVAVANDEATSETQLANLLDDLPIMSEVTLEMVKGEFIPE